MGNYGQVQAERREGQGREMIAIVNITPNPQPTGEHIYSLRINREEICQFRHTREGGLADCLLAAAKSAELADK